MTIKVSRVQQRKESYNITADWLSDFAGRLTKDAQIVEVFRSQGAEKFATIEEKMADMRARAGFVNVERIKKEPSLDKSACGHDPCKKCGKAQEKENLLNKLKSIINYVKATKKDRPDISYMQVLADCRELPEYKDISQKISNDKFKNYIKNIVVSDKPVYNQEIEYVPHAEAHQISFEDDMAAPYMPKE